MAGTNIYGQLIRAQMENSASDLASPAAGTFYWNTSTVIPKIYTGSAWLGITKQTPDMTGAVYLPTGTTAQRPTASTGMMRHNSDTGEFEGYTNSAWQSVGGGLNESPAKNYYKSYAQATIAPGTLSTVAATGNITLSGSGLSVTSAFYADATSGASALTQDTTSAVRGANSYLSALSSANTDGSVFFQFPAFVLDPVDLGKPVTVGLDIVSSIADGDYDVVMVRYNSSGTYQELIPIAGNASSATATPSAKLPTGTTRFQGFFVASSTSTDAYALRVRRLVGSATIKMDTLYVGPEKVVQGAGISDWVSYTPTLTSTTNATITYARWRKVGDSMQIIGSIIWAGAGGGSNFTISVPSGYTIDTNKISTNGQSIIGSADWSDNGTGYKALTPYASSDVIVFKETGSTNIWDGTQAANGDYLNWNVTLPITGWSSNVTMADRAVERYFYTSESFAATGSTTAEGFAGQVTANNAGVLYDKTITHNMPGAKPFLELSTDSGVTWFDADSLAPYGIMSGGVSGTSNIYGCRINSATSTTVSVRFGGYALAANDDSPTYDWGTSFNWRVRMVMPGAAVGYPIGARNIVGDVSGTTVPSGYIGEVISATITTTAATTSEADVTGATLALTPGVWDIRYSLSVYAQTGASSSNATYMMTCITDSANTHIGNTERIVGAKTVAATANYVESCSAATTIVYISANTTYKLRLKRTDGAGTGSGSVYASSGNYNSTFFAVRIA